MTQKFEKSQSELKEKSELLLSCQEELLSGNKQVFILTIFLIKSLIKS